jgi:CRP/FNR family cyclic AMP-dependent transcriptional regulator
MSESSNDRPIDFRILKGLDVADVTLQAGHTIIAEGGEGSVMYIVKSGVVEVFVNGISVEEIGEGSVFGEMALIEHSPRSARIVAKTDVVAVPLDERKFLALVAKVPHFGVLVMRSLARRIRRMNFKLASRVA